MKRRYDIVDVARSDNDVMVAWYSDGKVSKGNADDLGRISGLRESVRRGVPNSIEQWENAYENIEIRHLLSHTSGFTPGGEWAQAAIKYAEEIAGEDELELYQYSNKYVLSTRALLFKPAQSSEYSNHGMGLTGHLIEEITGKDWYDYVRDRIRTAGRRLRHRTYWHVQQRVDRFAFPHGQGAGQCQRRVS